MYVMLECGVYVQGINTIVYGVSQMLLGRFHVGLQGWIDDGFCGDFRASTGLWGIIYRQGPRLVH